MILIKDILAVACDRTHAIYIVLSPADFTMSRGNWSSMPGHFRLRPPSWTDWHTWLRSHAGIDPMIDKIYITYLRSRLHSQLHHAFQSSRSPWFWIFNWLKPITWLWRWLLNWLDVERSVANKSPSQDSNQQNGFKWVQMIFNEHEHPNKNFPLRQPTLPQSDVLSQNISWVIQQLLQT